jgi:hypothetical protein
MLFNFHPDTQYCLDREPYCAGRWRFLFHEFLRRLKILHGGLKKDFSFNKKINNLINFWVWDRGKKLRKINCDRKEKVAVSAWQKVFFSGCCGI